jgi:hypothetical protein
MISRARVHRALRDRLFCWVPKTGSQLHILHEPSPQPQIASFDRNCSRHAVVDRTEAIGHRVMTT